MKTYKEVTEGKNKTYKEGEDSPIKDIDDVLNQIKNNASAMHTSGDAESLQKMMNTLRGMVG